MHPDWDDTWEDWEEFPDDWYDGADEILHQAHKELLEKCYNKPCADKGEKGG